MSGRCLPGHKQDRSDERMSAESTILDKKLDLVAVNYQLSPIVDVSEALQRPSIKERQALTQ